MRRRWYDLIVCAHIRLLPLVRLLRVRKSVPVGLVLYGIDAWEPMGGLLTRQALRKLAWCAAITNITMERFLSWSGIAPARTFVIHNAVDTSRYSIGLKRADLSARHGLSGSIVLMTLGRLNATERYKGIDEVLEVLPFLLAKRPEIKYLVCGEGTDRMRLEKKARSLGIGEHVVFTGYIDEAEKIDYYRLADCFILAGWGEGFGFALIEAMACGVPVVASNLDGSREALANGELGVIVNPKNPSELMRGIETALTKTPGIVPTGLERFSYDAFEKKVHQLIVEPILR
jgi:glycosyltransferase involved in cell wall biosynthesis